MLGYSFGGQGGAERSASGGAAAGGGLWGTHPSYLGTQLTAGMQHMAPRPILNPAATSQDLVNMYRDFAMYAQPLAKASGRGRGGQVANYGARTQAPAYGVHPRMPQPPVLPKPSRPNYDRAQVLSSKPDEGERTRKVNKVIPTEVVALAPEAELFSQLVELENELDTKTQVFLQPRSL